MAISYVVSTSDPLRHVVRRWVRAVSGRCGEWHREVEPGGVVTIRWASSLDHNSPPPRLSYRMGLFAALSHEKWSRIQWFYYCDQEEGNTVRLYDAEFHAARPDLYLEAGNVGTDARHDDRVLIRGENLGPKGGTLKTALLACWDSPPWPADAAPADGRDGDRVYDLLARCPAWTQKRHAYFQHPFRNAMPNDDRDWRCPAAGCPCRGLSDGFYTSDVSPPSPPPGSSILDRLLAARSTRPTAAPPPPADFPGRRSHPREQDRRQRLEERRAVLLPILRDYLDGDPPEVFDLLAREVALATDADVTSDDVQFFFEWVWWMHGRIMTSAGECPTKAT